MEGPTDALRAFQSRTASEVMRQVIEQLFPRPLVECIRDARPPGEKEVDILSEKLWSEGLSFSPSGDRPRAKAMARAALGGSASGVSRQFRPA